MWEHLDRLPSTHDDVMLDWAIAEIASPTFGLNYVSQGFIDGALRERLLSENTNSEKLTQKERRDLLKAVHGYREPLFANYNCRINPAWNFYKVRTIPSRDLGSISITKYYSDTTRTNSLEEFASFLEKYPANEMSSQCRDMRGVLDEMMNYHGKGGVFRGTPIVIKKKNDVLLVEGYKRSTIALWAKQEFLDLFVCEANNDQ